MTSRSSEVLIVGAGPTGLVLALWLNRLGVALRIIDRAAGTGEASRALAVQPRTLEFYQALGLADKIQAAGVPARTVNLWVNGRKRVRVPFDSAGEGLSPFPVPLILPQDVHERVLVEHLREEGVGVDWQTALTGFEEDADGVTAHLAGGDGALEDHRANYLCGCDGASSTVRQRLGVGFPGGTYSQLFYVADVEASGDSVNGELHLSLQERDFCFLFPMQGSGRARLVGMVDRPGAGGQDLAYEEVGGQAERALGISVSRVNWFSTYHVHHRVAASFRRGRSFLLGDAAHIHSPAGGQGMNTGIGDAVNLAWKMVMVLGGLAGNSLLDTYEDERIAFAHRLVRTTDQAFRAAVDPSGIARFIRIRIVPAIAPLLARSRRIRRTAFRTVSQTGIAYRSSRLSEGRSGAVAGGDRLPWVREADGTTNFDALASLDWQVHAYGAARASLVDWCRGRGIALHVFAFGPQSRQAGLAQDAAYLVRPDGHVACAIPDQDPAAFVDYLVTRGLEIGALGRPPQK